MRMTKINQKEKRKKKLKQVLKNSGLELRSDSKLCGGYIEGKIKDKTIPEIVERMCQVKYLFDYCDMKKYLHKYHNFDKSERKILKKYGEYPDEWPWLI